MMRLLPFLELPSYENSVEVRSAKIPVYQCPSDPQPQGASKTYTSYGVNGGDGPYQWAWNCNSAAGTPLDPASYYCVYFPKNKLYFNGILDSTSSCKGGRGSGRTIRFSNITDGLTNTIAFGERWGQIYVPGTRTISSESILENTWNNTYSYFIALTGVKLNTSDDSSGGIWASYWGAFRSDHTGGANFLLADGSVRFINEGINRGSAPDYVYPEDTAAPSRGSINPNASGKVYRALGTIDETEVFNGEF